LWERVLERRRDPFVVETLGPVHTMKGWAEAARRIDEHFGSKAVRARIARQPEYQPRPGAPALPTAEPITPPAR
jgi:hypothetical protein